MSIAISKEYFNEIVKNCGEKIIPWTKEIPDIVNKCIEKWELTDVAMARNLSYNIIIFAKSKIYGNVVLKVCIPDTEFFTEVNALSIYNGRGICKLYDYDKDYHAMLIEKLSTDIDLRSVKSFEDRIKIGIDIIKELPILPDTDELTKFPSYADWLKKAFLKAGSDGKADNDLLDYIKIAETMFSRLSIDNKEQKELLLHGDLHHMNIINSDNIFTVIDPKGIRGYAQMEGSRFILNEMELFERDENKKIEELKYILIQFANALGTDEKTIFEYFFIETVLSICWSLEGSMSIDEYEKAMGDCEFIIRYGKENGFLC